MLVEPITLEELPIYIKKAIFYNRVLKLMKTHNVIPFDMLVAHYSLVGKYKNRMLILPFWWVVGPDNTLV
jgi:hypothetical protein